MSKLRNFFLEVCTIIIFWNQFGLWVNRLVLSFITSLLCIVGSKQGEGVWLWLLALVTCDRWHVAGDIWHVTGDIWHVRHDSFFCIHFVIVNNLGILSAQAENFSVFWRTLNESTSRPIQSITHDIRLCVCLSRPVGPGLNTSGQTS